jgi:hypothetical protein
MNFMVSGRWSSVITMRTFGAPAAATELRSVPPLINDVSAGTAKSAASIAVRELATAATRATRILATSSNTASSAFLLGVVDYAGGGEVNGKFGSGAASRLV